MSVTVFGGTHPITDDAKTLHDLVGLVHYRLS